ncbi:DUF294 nucleotidyltransferase-like domain-containing protein [Parasalinivibrio latis]|uniref:DUF294 nucleotidyltransferase-like domain-containing protein n=1 Tax=Parasalinivibrio latis TaxID=2952610 RepID=UPI0030DF0D19
MPDRFDATLTPFNRLSAGEQNKLRSSLDVGYFRGGETILPAGDAPGHLFIIIKGSVEETSASGDEIHAHYTNDDLFDIPSQFGKPSKHNYKALEDTLCYLLPSEIFRDLYSANGEFAAYFDNSLSKRQQLVEQAQQKQNLAEFILTRVDDSTIQQALIVPGTITIGDVTAEMRQQKADCVMVKLENHPHPWGIVTRTNLLHALVLDGYCVDSPISEIATSPVIQIEKGEYLYTAMLAMTREKVKRVQVMDGGECVGQLDLTQVLSLFATHSHVLTLRIARAESIEELAIAAHGQRKLVQTLVTNGIHTKFMMELLATVNEQIIEKAFRLVVPPKYQQHCCLMVLGSEGRGEQILKTDQDNALILNNDIDWPDCAEVMNQFSQTLAQLGYPPCPGNVMVSNPKWVKTQADWLQTIRVMTQNANHSSLMDLSIIADCHAVAGNKTLIEPLEETLSDCTRDNMLLLNTFIRAALAFRVPLSLFGNLKADKDGLDVKKGGIFPIVHGLRSLALEKGLTEKNSFDRLNALRQMGYLEEDTASNLEEALKLFITLRLSSQLEEEASGNNLDVSRLPRTERDLLRHSLHIVKKFKEWLAFHYQVRD